MMEVLSEQRWDDLMQSSSFVGTNDDLMQSSNFYRCKNTFAITPGDKHPR